MLSHRITKLERAASNLRAEAEHCHECHDGHVSRVVSITVFRDGAQTGEGLPGDGTYDTEGLCRSCGRRAVTDCELHLIRPSADN